MATRKAKAGDACRLTVTIRGTCYTARPVRSEAPEVPRAWRLRRADGTAHVVADTAGAAGGPESWPAWTDAACYTVTR